MASFEADVKINVCKVDDATCILDIDGELTAFAEDKLMGAYNDACGTPVQNVILNFERLEYMSSSGIGLLVTLLIRAQRQQQRLLASGLSDHYRHIFELTRLDEAIALYPTDQEAVAAVAALGSPARV
ncbi:MAG TPA: STAS domain-containing protein [Anaerolineae bacterium]|nr:STAS domain-containing protein [Anaerolineae bacterium]